MILKEIEIEIELKLNTKISIKKSRWKNGMI